MVSRPRKICRLPSRCTITKPVRAMPVSATRNFAPTVEVRNSPSQRKGDEEVVGAGAGGSAVLADIRGSGTADKGASSLFCFPRQTAKSDKGGHSTLTAQWQSHAQE